MAKKVYIRADGSSQIGLGHLVRCLALAGMLAGEYHVTFVCKEIPQTIADDIKAAGFGLLNIANEAHLLDILTGDEIVVLDHYGLDSGYQKELKAKGCKVVCIDDLQQGEFYADLIINHAPGITPGDYSAQPYTKFALGLTFALLRPAFLKAAKQPRSTGSVKSIFICFGGADPDNLTLQAVNAVAEVNAFDNINVVTGAAYLYKDSLSGFPGGQVQLYSGLAEQEMCSLMQRCDVAIVPSSTILLEAVACGLAVITCYYADNQKDFHDNMVKRGITSTGLADDGYKEKLKQKLAQVSVYSSSGLRGDFSAITENILNAFRL